MHIEKAKKLRVGNMVRYPADRGDPAGSGRVTHVLPDSPVQTNHQGHEYIWVEVQMLNKKTLWPSNRLS